MTQIKLRRDTSAAFASSNPILGNGEPAYETDTKKLKIGDGTTAYTQLEYFSAGGGSSTDISATLPLKIVDGVISLEVDGQTIQIVDGKLHANLDELGNEVNTLAGDVAGVQADLLKKEDKLTASSPIIKTEEEKPNAVGFTTSGTTMTTSGNYSDGDWGNQAYGLFVLEDYMAGTKDNYVDIPYQIGDIVKVPQSSGFYNVSTGAFGFINNSGAFRPVAPLYDSGNRSQSRYDEVTIEPYKRGYYLNSTNSISWGGTISMITTKARNNYNYCQIRDEGTSVVLITASFGSNTSLVKRVFLKTENDGIQYDKLLKSTMVRVYPRGNQREVLDTSFDTSQFGLYKGLGKLEDLAPNFETIEAATNQFNVLGTTKVNDLSLALGNGLSVVDGKLVNTNPTAYSLPTASSSVIGGVKIGNNLSITEDGTLSATGGGSSEPPANMVTTDTIQTISGGKTFEDKIVFNRPESDTAEQTSILGGEFKLGTSNYDNSIYANQLLLNANTTNEGTFKVQTLSSNLTQISGATITSQKTSTGAYKIMSTIRPSRASSNKNYSVLYSEVDNSYNHKLTINNLTSDLVLAGKTVKDGSGNKFLTSGDKETIMGYMVPDYSTRTAVPWDTDNTAPTDGYVEICGEGDGDTSSFILKYTLNGVKTAVSSCYSSARNTNFRLPVICPKGTVYRATGGAVLHELYFISMKGAV